MCWSCVLESMEEGELVVGWTDADVTIERCEG